MTIDTVSEVVMDYVQTGNTDYAVLINGKWGSGKTHFWANYLKPQLEKAKLKPIYVSLYGVRSLSEVAQQIFFGLMSHTAMMQKAQSTKLWSKVKPLEKYTGVVSEIGKAVISGFATFTGHAFPQVTLDYEKLTNLDDECILCFDDLERSKLAIEELLGFMNNFVEHGNAKVLIIGNEDEIINLFQRENLEQKMLVAVYSLDETAKSDTDKVFERTRDLFTHNQYENIKEKLIGITVSYTPNTRDVIHSIVNSYEEFDKDYTKFLSGIETELCDFFNRSGTENFRTFRFSLNMFRKVYTHLKSSHNVDTESVKKLLWLTLAIASEIKSGAASKEQLEELLKVGSSLQSLLFNAQENTIDYSSVFVQKYFRDSQELFWSKSVVYYIVTGHLDVDELGEEIVPLKKMVDHDPITLLVRGEYWLLSDDEFSSATGMVMKMVREGKQLTLSTYPRLFTTFAYLQRQGLLNMPMEALIELFMDGLDQAKLASEYNEFLATYNVLFATSVPGTIRTEFQKVYDRAVELNNELLEEKRKATGKHVATLFQQNVQEFCRYLYDESLGFASTPLFTYLDIGHLANETVTKDNSDIVYLRNALIERYKASNIRQFLGDEYAPLVNLKEHLTTTISTSSDMKSLKSYLIEELIATLDEICNRLRPEREQQSCDS
ncbi:MAG: P-loop NTPase fold protein [Alicyclobacillaceae bacterium]|nr:P-loop NTPase fold protein [Alicyclobacillaceae bacterium]